MKDKTKGIKDTENNETTRSASQKHDKEDALHSNTSTCTCRPNNSMLEIAYFIA